MIEQVAAAIKRQDYSQASRLLQPLMKAQPHNPWVQLYSGQIHEACRRPAQALVIYRHLLQTTANQQVVQRARQGISRLGAPNFGSPPAAPLSRTDSSRTDSSRTESPPAASSPAASSPPGSSSTNSSPSGPSPDAPALNAPDPSAPDPNEPQPPPKRSQPTHAGEAILVLQPVPEAERDRAIRAFAQTASVDPYTARTQLPVRGWRLHRIGELAPLLRYREQLRQADVTALLLPTQAMLDIHVFRVKTFRQISSPSVLCENHAGQLGNLTFTWQEVAQWVEGRLPIFEEVVDMDARKRLLRKQKTQDYAHLLDLHLPERRSILRLCDQTYQFSGQFSEPVPPHRPGSDRSRQAGLGQINLRMTRQRQWQALKQDLFAHGDRPVWSDFIPFAESTLDGLDTLPDFDPHVDILRKQKTPWDKAFHIYSSLVFSLAAG
ncbi:MAG: tol-pal system YbgF family protein [Elainellaceae cyanobacterium]